MKPQVHSQAMACISALAALALVCTSPQNPLHSPAEIQYTTTYIVGHVGKALDVAGPDISNGVFVSEFAISGALPAGLSFDTSCGAISGAPDSVFSKTEFTITATNAYGTGSTTLELTIRPASPRGLETPPAGGGEARIVWHTVAGADSFKVSRSLDSQGDFTVVTSSSDTFFVDSGLTADSIYHYFVLAITDGVGPSQPSDTISITVSRGQHRSCRCSGCVLHA